MPSLLAPVGVCCCVGRGLLRLARPTLGFDCLASTVRRRRVHRARNRGGGDALDHTWLSEHRLVVYFSSSDVAVG